MVEANSERKDRLPVSVSAAVLIEDERGRLLLVQQESEGKGQKWGPPAGGMRAHEDPTNTAKREAREELGIEVELTGLVGIYTTDRGNDRSGLGFVFRGRIASGEAKPTKGEIQNYGYFDKEEIERIISQDLLYRPEYNVVGIHDWQSGNNYPLEVIKGVIK